MIIAIEESISKGSAEPGTITYQYPETDANAAPVSYSATIANRWDPTAPFGHRYYLISSTGTVGTAGVAGESLSRTVNVIIRAVSTGSVAWGSRYPNNQFNLPVWYTPDQQFDGPVYDGGPMHVEYDDKSANPIFLSTVQTPNTPFWDDIQNGSTSAPSAWSSIISVQKDFSIGGNPLGLPDPQSNVLVASEAFYGDPTTLGQNGSFPACSGVCMDQVAAETGSGQLTTGIFVNGNATISGSSSGNVETLHINGKSVGNYTVTIDFGNNRTTVSRAGAMTTGSYLGVPSGDNGPGSGNGAIFVNGDATLLLGSVIQGDYLLTVPDYANAQVSNLKNIDIAGAGSITYANSSKDELGLWANDVVLTTAASDVTIDGSIIAGYPGEVSTDGGLYNGQCNRNNCKAGDQGTLTIFGAIMENMHGAVGKFFSATSHVGFDRHIQYDPRMASNPPPFYPVTGNYSIVAWDDEGQ